MTELSREIQSERQLDTFDFLFARPAWWGRALCHGQTDAFFSSHYSGKQERDRHRAELRHRFCNHCPVSAECAEAGRDEQFGVWGEA